MEQAFVPALAPLRAWKASTAHKSRAVSVSAVRQTPRCGADPLHREERWASISRGVVSAALAAFLAFNTTVPAFVGHDSAVLAAKRTRNGGGTFKSASGRVIKDPESLLRWALPIDNKPVRELQASLEEITYQLRAFKWSNIENEVKKSTTIVTKKGFLMLDNVEASQRNSGKDILQGIEPKLTELKDVVTLRDGEETVRISRDILRDVGKLEELMISTFPYEIPSEYANLPVLKGRATVEMQLAKAEGEQFDIDGELYDTGKMTMVIDGYSAPVTSGNFVDLVNKGFYNNMEINRSDGFVVQTGDPEGPSDGYIDPATKQLRNIPLEIFAQGDPSPTYGITLEDDGRATESTVLPFTAYGTMGMAREEFSADTASSQFFWFLFEPDLTPAGRNLLDGRYTVFGYVTEGEYFLRDLKPGDIITESKVVSGLGKFSAPKSAEVAPPAETAAPAEADLASAE